MFNKRHNVSPYDGAGVSNMRKSKQQPGSSNTLIVRNNNVDEGVIAFGLWLNLEGKDSRIVPIAMKKFDQNREVLLHDNILQKDVSVRIVEGIPICNGCRANDCAHVGFAICAEQMHFRSR